MDYLRIYRKGEYMEKNTRIFTIIALLGALILLILSFINTAFISAFMLWVSLFIFSICYNIRDEEDNTKLYILFIIVVLLIIGSVIYMVMRIR